MFIGRERELKLLSKCYSSKKAELFVLYGRRRVGKTELLKEFIKGKKAIYFAASQVEPEDNLSNFRAIVMEVTQDSVIEGFASFDPLIRYLAKSTAEYSEKLVLVIDEFPYWADADRSLMSILQNFWDSVGKDSNLMLILCGSSVSFMIEHVLAEKSPLYGRTGQYELKPFDYRTACEFFPNYDKKDKLIAYGILGGIPAYLNQFDPDAGLKENIISTVLTKGTYLNQEALFLLKTELRDVKIYNTLLKTIAAGNTTLKDITSKMQKDRQGISSYLATLQELSLVLREVSFNETAPEKSRKGRYRIQDNFLNFWYRFPAERLSLIELDQAELIYEQYVQPQLSTYMGPVFEDICRQYVALYGKEVGLPTPKEFVGRIWDKDFDIDVVTIGTDDTVMVGECKWSIPMLKPTLYGELQKDAASALPNIPTDKLQMLLFCADPIPNKANPEEKNLTYIDLEDLLP